MNLKNSFTITKRIFWQIRHDKRTIFMLIVTPLLIMLIFGYSFGGNVTDVKVIVVNNDKGFIGENLADSIIEKMGNETLNIEYSRNVDDAKESVDDGKAWGAIIFPSNFSSATLKGKGAIYTYLDDSSPTVAEAVIRTLSQAVTDTIGERGIKPPISVIKSHAHGEEGVEFIDFFAPGIICMVTMILSLILTIVFFVRERTIGTLDRLLASPTTEGEIVTGYILAFTIISLIQTLILFSVAVLFFGISIQGDIPLAFSIVLLSAIGFQGLGMVLSTVARTEFQAVQFIPLLIVPSILLAGIFWPLEAIPPIVRPISYFIPLTYAADALRSVTIRGWGVDKILIDLLILSIFAITTIWLNFLIIKRR